MYVCNYIRDTATIFSVMSSIYGTGVICQMGSMDRDFSVPTGIILSIISLLIKSVGERYRQKAFKAK